MSEQKELAPYLNAIYGSEKHFLELAGDTLDFQKEAVHARAACENNPFLMKIAQDNSYSLQMAIYSVATIGLTLNKVHSYAYLVPRGRKVDGKKIWEICLDISYKGLLKIATDTGSIMWAQAEIVYEGDTFEYRGPTEKPVHIADPFQGEKKPKGVYCIAKTKEGDFLVETMDIAELDKIKSKSESATSDYPQYSPWNTFWSEMAKKAVIKRASKTWPKTEKMERFNTAVEILNEHQGIEFNKHHTPEQLSYFKSNCDPKNSDEIALFGFYKSLEMEEWNSLSRAYISDFPKGKPGNPVRGNEWDRIEALIKQGEAQVHDLITELNETDDEILIMEILDGLDSSTLDYVMISLPPETMAKIELIRRAA